MPFRRPLTLRALVLIGSGLLSVCGIVAAVALIVMTSYLHGVSQTVSEAVNSVVATEELQKSLLEYSKDRMLVAVGSNGVREEAIAALEEEIQHWYVRIERHASTLEERHVIDEVQDLIDGYISSRHVPSMTSNDPREVMRLGIEYLDPARARIRDLVMLNKQQADHAMAEIERQDRFADRLGVTISGLLILLIVALLFGLRAQVYKPLMAIGKALKSFGQGRLETRTLAKGPVEIQEISRVFNEMADGLERGRADNLRFIAAVAHDLRNPISAIKMSFDLVNSPGFSDDGQRREIERIAMRQLDQLDQLVGDLLDRSRIESGKFSLDRQKRDLRIDVEQATQLYAKVSRIHTLDLKLPAGAVRCEYDSLRVSQVLNNLIGNAIKYSPNGGRVEVSLGQCGAEAVIEVRDQGIGIAPDEVDRIFEPFRRSKATRDTIPGVGLGLAVARRLVEAHGGLLEVVSTVGSGSTFRVRLPALAVASAEAGSNVAYLSPSASDLVARGG